MSDLYEIVDPRPIASSAKYTYFLPPLARLEAIRRGDLVKITMRAIPASKKWDGERVWVRILAATSDWLEGTLESEPDDMPRTPRGTILGFPRTHVMDIIFENPEEEGHVPRRGVGSDGEAVREARPQGAL